MADEGAPSVAYGSILPPTSSSASLALRSTHTARASHQGGSRGTPLADVMNVKTHLRYLKEEGTRLLEFIEKDSNRLFLLYLLENAEGVVKSNNSLGE